jgi:hypothetical protein
MLLGMCFAKETSGSHIWLAPLQAGPGRPRHVAGASGSRCLPFRFLKFYSSAVRRTSQSVAVFLCTTDWNSIVRGIQRWTTHFGTREGVRGLEGPATCREPPAPAACLSAF